MRPGSQGGFVLAVVLWSIAALTLITGGIVARINATLEQAYRMRELAEREQAMMATEQTLLYLLSAKRWNAAGLDLTPNASPAMPADPFAPAVEPENGPTLRFDGTVYPGIGPVNFAIQDAGATFSLLEPRRETWHQLLALLGVERDVADKWLDQLEDYQDLDDLERLNGAEADTYRARGLTPPPNRFMVSPHELRNLPIARRHPGVTEKLIHLATAGTGTLANLNTSPAEILQVLHHLSPRDARRVTGHREGHLLRSTTDASATYGVLFQGGAFFSVWQPSGYVRIAFGDPEGRHKRWIAVRFTPNANGRPWIIEYNHPVNLRRREQETDTPDAFSPRFQTEAAPPAPRWAHYPAFFPPQLPVGR